MELPMNDYLATLREMRDKALQGGGAERIMQLHSSGKLTARQQLTLLLDAGSFQELDALATHNISDFGMAEQRFPGDGVVTSFGRVDIQTPIHTLVLYPEPTLVKYHFMLTPTNH